LLYVDSEDNKGNYRCLVKTKTKMKRRKNERTTERPNAFETFVAQCNSDKNRLGLSLEQVVLLRFKKAKKVSSHMIWYDMIWYDTSLEKYWTKQKILMKNIFNCKRLLIIFNPIDQKNQNPV
jgi:hypothetical protein